MNGDLSPDDTVSRFEKTVLAPLAVFPPGAVLLLAVSGGADSTAMLCALVAAYPSAFSLRCVHVEHGIRPPPESRGDAAAVTRLCGELGVPCRVVTVPQGRIAGMAHKRGTGLEAAARFYRRRILKREARRAGAAAILTAHTRGDLLETILMRFLRGSGPRGLAAMPQKTADAVPFVRPLLSLERSDVETYLALRNIPFRTDATNRDGRFLRNRIRNRLVPLLDDLFPHWEKGTLALGATQSLAASFIEEEAGRRVIWEKTDGGLRTAELPFFAEHPVIREEALFQGMDMLAGHENALSARRLCVRRFCAGGTAADLGKNIRAGRERGFVVLSLAGTEETGFSLLIKEPGLYTLKKAFLPVSPVLEVGLPEETAGKDGNVFFVRLPFVLRNAWPGDFPLRGGKRRRPGGVNARVLCAADVRGNAAFMGEGVFFAREAEPGDVRVLVRTGVVNESS
ncbi:MAG: tRNA lysidine(34) synthetase TilS [Treponema sp.]|nr:tRNA lysidine(34) synthetase TilS [Treponema sp.]